MLTVSHSHSCKFVAAGLFVVFVLVVCIIKLAAVSSGERYGRHKGPRAVDSLKFLVIVSRHGNRGGLDYPNDPYPSSDLKYWPYGMEGLTPFGRVQMHRLGRRVRSLYDGFLETMFRPEELRASSTAMDRLIMSAELFLAGLYPPQGFQVWNKDILWQPVPVYSDSLDKTPVMLQMTCPRFVKEILQAFPNWLGRHSENISRIVNIINEETGLNIAKSNIMELTKTWDKLISEETEGYTIPSWTEKIYPLPLAQVVGDLYLFISAETDEIVRLWMGEFFTELIEAVKAKVGGSAASKKLQYYSGHDISIIALQVLLGVPRAEVISVVRTGSALIMELHQSTTSGNFYVKVLYIDGGDPHLELRTIQIPECSQPCDFNQLLKNTEKFVNVSFEDECKDSTFNSSSNTFPFLDKWLRTRY